MHRPALCVCALTHSVFVPSFFLLSRSLPEETVPSCVALWGLGHWLVIWRLEGGIVRAAADRQIILTHTHTRTVALVH